MRNYGRFTTGIFRDEDFRALTAAEQGVYFMLGLQPEMSAAGTLSLTLRRWAATSAGMTRDELADHIGVLAERGHLVVDFDTEELLIRKFIKWDGGIENSKRQPVVLEAACTIESERIRHAIAHELVRLGHTDMAFQVASDAVPDTQSQSDRGVVTEGESVPHPSTPIPESSSPSADAEPKPPNLTKDTDPRFVEFWSTYPKRVAKAEALKALAKVLAAGTPIEDVVKGAQRYRDDPKRDPEFTAHPATWLNAGRWTDEPFAQRPSQSPPSDRRPGDFSHLRASTDW